MYNVILNMYNAIESCISYNNCKSDYLSGDMGVRQGAKSVTFSVCTVLKRFQSFLEKENLPGLKTISEKIEENLNIYLKPFVLLYADDTVIVVESREDLQAQLHVFEEYCKKWKLKVNVEKTKIFIFSRGRPLEDIQFSLNGSEIEIVNEFNYLVILLNRTGNFNKAITKQAEKAKQVMYEVSKRGRTHNLSVECQLELFFFLITDNFIALIAVNNSLGIQFLPSIPSC